MTEVELRCFLDEEAYNRLKRSLVSRGVLEEDTRQITHYLGHPVDTRVQMSRDSGRVWQKLGRMHDTARQEIDAPMSRTAAERMYEIFMNLGFQTKVSWYRHRLVFRSDGLSVALDNTVGYGRILEVEAVCEESEFRIQEARLVELLSSLGLKASPKEDFDRAFGDYLLYWKERTAGLGPHWIDEH